MREQIIFIGGSYNNQIKYIHYHLICNNYLELPYNQTQEETSTFGSSENIKHETELERYYIYSIQFFDGFNNINFNLAIKRPELKKVIAKELQHEKIKTYGDLQKWIKKYY